MNTATNTNEPRFLDLLDLLNDAQDALTTDQRARFDNYLIGALASVMDRTPEGRAAWTEAVTFTARQVNR